MAFPHISSYEFQTLKPKDVELRLIEREVLPKPMTFAPRIKFPLPAFYVLGAQAGLG